MSTKRLGKFAVVAIALLSAAGGTAYAQAEAERGRVELGVRQLYGERNSAKFFEYRDIPQGAFVKHAEVELHELLEKSFFFGFQARDVREEDQTYLVSLGIARKYRLDLKWDQTPHVFTTTARSFLVESSPGVFVAPEAVRNALISAGTNVSILRSVLGSSPSVPMSLRRDKGTGTLSFTPTTDWTANVSYSREKMVGYRPFGTITNSFTNIIELPEPIDYRTHQVGAGAEYADSTWTFQTNYYGSIFDNRVGELIWDVPFATTGTQSTRARLDLYPSNHAQNLSFAGGVSLPHGTRLVASIVPGWMGQNDSFLPLTINPNLTGLPALPASSLDGKKQTLAMNYTLTSKAIPMLPLTLRFNSYDYNNNTPEITFPQVVINDSSVTALTDPHTSEPFGYDRKNLELNASWHFLEDSSLKFLYNWERFNREHREVEQSTEHTVGTSLDVNPYQWLLLRGSYRHGSRDPEEYVGSSAMLPSLRKYDEAGRTRHRAEALLQITPLEQVSFGASYGTTQDDYEEEGCAWLGFDQCYGLLKDISNNYTFELTYDPTAQLSLFAEYTREKYNYRQLSRQRNPASATAPANDSPNNDWETTRRDHVDNYAVGLGASPSSKVVVDLFYSLSVAINKLTTRALGYPAIAGYLVTTAPPYPGVSDYPDTSNRWHQMVSSVKFPLLSGNLTPKLEYRYEKYDRIDFQLASVGQYFTDSQLASSLFLGVGADVPGYVAHIVAASLEYRF
jgi:MtrB/PioB family decaheme-associated outer membrane protein